MNKEKQSKRDDPDREGSVSSDKEEDTVPDHLAFDVMAEILHSESMRTPGVSNQLSTDLPTTHIPTQPDAPTAPDGDNPTSPMNKPDPPKTTNQTVDWAAVINAAHPHTADGLSGKELLMGLMDDLASIGYIFRHDSCKPEYTMDAHMILNPILQMAFLKLYIPLLLLTTTALYKIHFNDGLKYQKILFGNGAGKHTLDVSLFPNELSLTKSEFWQA